MKKESIAIIGGGAAGLTSAWLLEDQYNVTLFEQENRLGGHAHTIAVPHQNGTIAIEAGAEFFSASMFGHLERFLTILDVPKRQYPLTYTFENITTGDYTILPPVHDGIIEWHSLSPTNFFDLTQFKKFVDAGNTLIAQKNTAITIEEFANMINLQKEFLEHFLYPFFAAAWGASIYDLKNFAAYDIVKWTFLNRSAHAKAAHWFEIVGGMSAYINALVKQLQYTTCIYPTTITGIHYRDKKYAVTQANGGTHLFDHLIVATNAMSAHQLIKDISHAKDVRDILSTIEYFSATIAVHGDRRLMPTDESRWSVVNIRYDGDAAASTIYKPWLGTLPTFRSWITHPVGTTNSPLPQPLYALQHFYHGKVTPAYFKAQEMLANLQGNNNLWFAGIYTHDEDSHNSALASAIKIGQILAPESLRLAQISA